MHASIHAYMHTCIRAYMHAEIHSCMHTSFHTYIHTSNPTCIAIYTCVYIYKYICVYTYLVLYVYTSVVASNSNSRLSLGGARYREWTVISTKLDSYFGRQKLLLPKVVPGGSRNSCQTPPHNSLPSAPKIAVSKRHVMRESKKQALSCIK